MGEGASVFEWTMSSLLFFVAFTGLCNNPNNYRPSHLYQGYSQRAKIMYSRSLLSTAEDHAHTDRPLRMQFYLMQAEAIGDSNTEIEARKIRQIYFNP